MNFALNSTFRPFTYDEMVKPLVQYKEVYDKLEQDYSDLTAQTEMWKDVVNQTNSPEAYEMYQRYSNDLAAVTESFSRGMNLNNRRALLGMKRRYAQDITPIAQADAAMKAANEFRAKMEPDAIFQVGEYTSLDKFLHGKTANNKYQSREALTKKTAAMTEAAMAEALRDPEFQKAMGNQFWMITQHTGGSYEELTEAMKLGMIDNPIAQNRFSQIRQQVARNAGIQNYDVAGQQAIMEAIDTGLYAGLDKPVRSFQANADHITPVQRHQMAVQDAQLALAKDELQFKKDQTAKAEETAKAKAAAKAKAEAQRANRLKKPVKVRATNKGGGSDDYAVGASWAIETIPDGASMKSYGSLTPEQKKVVDTTIGTDTIEGYNYYVIQEDASGVGTGDDDLVIIVPKTTVTNAANDIDEDDY